jgi:hypothetical protein
MSTFTAFWPDLHSLVVTMSQKSSVPKIPQNVPRALTSDTYALVKLLHMAICRAISPSSRYLAAGPVRLRDRLISPFAKLSETP